MMKVAPCLVCLLLVTDLCVSQHLSPRIANYTMHVTLDTDGRYLDGSTQLYWKNPSTDTIGELQFHLYYNAFKHSQSTWLREKEGYTFLNFLGDRWKNDCGWGWSAILDMRDTDGNDLTPGFAFIQPDDDNIHDETVLRVPLSIPVLPNDSARFDFRWRAKIPKTMIRTGYNKDFYFFAQWFPKLGVYEPAGMRYATTGGWNCHQYHALGEYYADFGVYHVHLAVPDHFTIGASGILVQKTPQEDNMTTWSFRAEDVIDFAWAASPHFTVLQDRWRDVDISLLMYPEHRRFSSRYLESLGYVMEFMHTHLGTYPYPSLTMIDPPIHGMYIGGMEYPMLITAFSTPLLPAGVRSTETLVVHEFIHQYFMQMVATHEVEEPWMDEGITSYYEARIMDEAYGARTSMIDCGRLHCGNLEYTRHEFFASGMAQIAPNTLRSWEYRHGGYYMISYNKVVLWLKTLEGLIGLEVFDDAMRRYFERWRFGHPCARDFIDVFNEVITARLPEKYPQGMDWYFAQVLEGTGICDYGVAAIENTPVRSATGFLNDTAECVQPETQPSTAAIQYASRVIVHRLGEIMLPVEVRITFDDGHTVMEMWDGQSRSMEFSYQGAARIVSAELDPERKIVLDSNFNNNSLTTTVQRMGLRYYFIRSMTVIQHLMESLSLLM